MAMRIACGALLFICCGLGGYILKSQAVHSPGLKPFVAYQRKNSYGPNGELRTTTEFVIARKADGSYSNRFTITSPAGEKAWHLGFTDIATRRNAWLEQFTKSVMTFNMSDADVRAAVENELQCSAPDVRRQLEDKSGKSSKILGHDAREVIAKEKHVTVWAWVAPELDCFPLVQTESFADGSRNEKRVERIAVGDPPQSLFTVPADYVERSPEEIEAAYRAKYPGSSVLWGRTLQTLQERYRRQRGR